METTLNVRVFAKKGLHSPYYYVRFQYSKVYAHSFCVRLQRSTYISTVEHIHCISALETLCQHYYFIHIQRRANKSQFTPQLQIIPTLLPLAFEQ